MEMIQSRWFILLGFLFLITVFSQQTHAKKALEAPQLNHSNTVLLPHLNTPTTIPTTNETTQEEIQPDSNSLSIINLKDTFSEETASTSGFHTWWQGDYATGDWMGLRTNLKNHGITIGIGYLTDSFQKLRGGSSSKDPFKTYGSVNTNITLDTEKMGLWRGGTAFIRFQNKHGVGLVKDFTGDFQFFDGYDGRRFAHVGEYWYEQSLFKDHLKFKLGKQNADDDFTSLDSGFNFISHSFTYMPTMLALPTVPETVLGALITIKPLPWLSLKSGIYDGDGKGGTLGFNTAFSGESSAFLIQEADMTHNIKNHAGHYKVGYWLKTKHTAELASVPTARVFGQNLGWYMVGEQLLWKENQTQNDSQGLSILGQFSWSPSDRSEVTRYFGVGAQYKGLLLRRNKDIIGIGTEIAKFSERLKKIPSDGRSGRETILELFYQIRLNPWLSLQPDMQFIFNPNGKHPTAFVIGFRTCLTL